MKKMKTTYLFALWLTNAFTAWLTKVGGWEGWSLFGWSLAGATVWVLYEVVEGRERSTKNRLFLILIGLFWGMAFSRAVSDYWHTNLIATASGLSLFGYVLLGPAKDFILKWVAAKADALAKKGDETPPTAL